MTEVKLKLVTKNMPNTYSGPRFKTTREPLAMDSDRQRLHMHKVVYKFKTHTAEC